MATLVELARSHTRLTADDAAHLQRLAAAWGMLADLCFADLLLLAPVAGEEGHRFVVLAQVRPTTDQTLYRDDMVGTIVDEVERPLIARVWRIGEIGVGDAPVIGSTTARANVQAIPVRHRGKVIPLLEEGTANGALLLMRDVSELRRRDRMLLSKDATIREIHHRVKNNLQTIASLLRLQGRRLSSPEAKQALEESVRRIRSIALVHETLAYEAGNTVPFGEIIRPSVRVVEDGRVSPARHIRFHVEGDPGDLPAEVATPLAVVLTELLQNAVEHGFPDNGSGEMREGSGTVRLVREADEAVVDVVDDGVGLPPDFSPETASGLGLSIVGTLAQSELAGELTMKNDGGTRVHLRVPIAAPRVER